jgi:hypothetical protein
MAAAVQNPIATDHVPFFVTPPGGTDVVFQMVTWFVLLCVVGLGVIFFTIHTLPERMAHRTKKVQLDIVAILGLIALFTNEHIYWIAALILAFIELPDFLTPFQRIAVAVENMTEQKAGGEAETADSSAVTTKLEPVAADRAGGGYLPGAETAEAAASRPVSKGSAHA